MQVEPEQHRLGVRGKITLRNESQSPQKIAVLQVSSSLDWRSVKAGEKAVQFVTQPYTSDIDHTGGLSEAIVTLPQAVAPNGTIELEIAYEGVILLDATRLTRIGTPEEAAKSTDWDQIRPDFTAVRGAGYVAWYPIATEVANLSEGNSLFEVLGRWKARQPHRKCTFISECRERTTSVRSCWSSIRRPVSFSMKRRGLRRAPAQTARTSDWDCSRRFSWWGPTEPSTVRRFESITCKTHAASAESMPTLPRRSVPLVTDWFGPPREKAQTADLADPNALPFESGALLLTPLGGGNSTQAGLSAAHQLTHASFLSSRPWIEEGLAHFAQALYLEREKGRPAALEYMGLHRSSLGAIEESDNRAADPTTR